jgi:hypothetical protein
MPPPTPPASYRTVDLPHDPDRPPTLSARARLATGQAVSRLMLHAQRTGQHELGASATVAREFLRQHGSACLSAGAGPALEMLLEPLLLALTTSASAEMMALALPAVHRLLPYISGAMLSTQIPTTQGFPFLATVIESLAEGISSALSFHGVGVLLHQLLHALSLVFGMMAPQHLPRETLSMLVLALFRLMLRASAAPENPGAAACSLPLSELLAPAEALFHKLGATTCGWLADTATPISPTARAATATAAIAGKVDWVGIEDSASRFISQPPAAAGGPDSLLGERVLTDAIVEGWLSAISDSTGAGRPALQLIAALGKLMIFEMPVSSTNRQQQRSLRLIADLRICRAVVRLAG